MTTFSLYRQLALVGCPVNLGQADLSALVHALVRHAETMPHDEPASVWYDYQATYCRGVLPTRSGTENAWRRHLALERVKRSYPTLQETRS